MDEKRILSFFFSHKAKKNFAKTLKNREKLFTRESRNCGLASKLLRIS